MKITDLSTECEDPRVAPCDLVWQFAMFDSRGQTLDDFLLSFDYDSEEEIRQAAWAVMDSCANDKFLLAGEKHGMEQRLVSIHARFKKIDLDARKHDDFPKEIAERLWHGGYSRKRLDENVRELFSREPDREQFAAVSDTIKRVYSFTDEDMEKIHFFVEQCKAGRSFPNSLRRMLYFYGETKKTGKTTSASCIVEILNGYTGEYNEARDFKTDLSTELKIKDFAVPKIASCNVCLMDECFYHDMGKTYDSWKAFVTSSDGEARLPYGKAFKWYGLPNYVATSNNPLRKFIKDYNDRRYLAVKFEYKPTVEVKDFQAIKELWKEYILNSTRDKDWMDWANEIAVFSDESGEKQEYSDEYANEMRKPGFLQTIIELPESPCRTSSINRVYTKFIVDFFRVSSGLDAGKHRQEIENAAIGVFGKKYNGEYWLLPAMKLRAQELLAEAKGFVSEPQIDVSDMPF